MIKNRDKIFLDEAFHLDSDKEMWDSCPWYFELSKGVIGDNNWAFFIDETIGNKAPINKFLSTLEPPTLNKILPLQCLLAYSGWKIKTLLAVSNFLTLCNECANKGDTDYKMNFYTKNFSKKINFSIKEPYVYFKYSIDFNKKDFNSLEISILGKKICENLIYTIKELQTVISGIEITGNDTESIRCKVLDHYLKMSEYEIDIVYSFIDFMYYLWKNTLPYNTKITETNEKKYTEAVVLRV